MTQSPVTPCQRSAAAPHPAWDLLGRCVAVVKAAWQARHELAGPRRLADERAFLPAALSLQDTPMHPAPRRAAGVICALFVIALVWACLGELDVVAVAPGRIVVDQRSKIIQPLEAAVVRAIHVRDGDAVSVGQLLVELDPTASRADGSRVTEERRSALGEGLRAEGLLAALGSDAEPRLPAPAAQDAEDWRTEDRVAAAAHMLAEWQEHRAKMARLNAEQARRGAQLDTSREVAAKLKATIPLARQREADYRGLTEQGFVSGHAGQDRMRERIELERDLATARARIGEDLAGLSESKRGLAAYMAEARRHWHDRASQARLKLAELTQEHAKAAQRHAQTRLSAPVSGIVQQLTIHTAGGVVTPAQALMVIVPDTDSAAQLVAEVSIENKDIGFVQSGQRAELKFETFNYTRYGTVPATVQWVTADAVVQNTAGGNRAADGDKASQATGPATFPARLLLARGDINVDGKTVRLNPGLNLTAEVKLGRRRVIDYLLSPVQKSLGESLRER